jgi:hypothetical protein
MMGRFLPLLMMVLLIGCSQAPGGATTGAAPGSAAPGLSGGPTAEAPSSNESAPPSASTTVVLPVKCAEGLAAYLVAIEPIVASFDPATGTLGDLSTVDRATNEKSYELLDANGGRAPYSCSEVGLEWAYFDPRTPWDAVLAVAAQSAPGTVAYLNGLRATTALDEAELSDYAITGCDDAVAAIKQRVAAQMSAGTDDVEAMPYDDGLELLGLYKAYIRQVQLEACPRDALGNDEFGFIGTAG